MAIRLPEREGKPDSITGFYPVGFDDIFLGSASENSMAASPAGRHHHGLVIKLPVVTADIEVVAGIVFKVGRQPVHQQGGHHARRHNPAERVINAVQRIVARVDNHQMVSYFFGKTLNAFVQRPASPSPFTRNSGTSFSSSSRVPWKNSAELTDFVRFHCISSRIHIENR